jgi:energy-coupling factor transporter ATP-binding protein EcfA2
VSPYDFHQLGWHNFQQLCLTISREVLGQTVQIFLDSKDGGRDGAFSGMWTPQHGEDLSGRFVIQCKFTSKVEKSLTLSDLRDEFAKVKRLVQEGRCDCYLLLTNFGISGVTDEKIEEAFIALGVKQFRCYGADWISQQIRESSRLRMLVPRIYGLGDLSQILDERAYKQARAVLESMREDLSRVVLTGAYSKAVRALESDSFVLLLGEPACGKTTIAAMLAMASIDQWKVSTLKLETSQQMVERWNVEEPKQFFWIDDAFGVTQYESQLALDWNRIFSKLRAMIDAGARIVLTSRDYIYRRAKQDLKESAFPVMRESQVVVNVQDITKEEPRQILYNHIKLGSQPLAFRSQMKPLLEDVVNHGRFTPEIARRLGNPKFTGNLRLTRVVVADFVERQGQFLQEIIRELDKHSRAALALIFMRNDALESPVKLRDSESSALVRLGSDLGETLGALDALQGSFTVHVRDENQTMWKFRHPTVGDAFGSIVLRNPELMDIYIEGAPAEKLLSTITCGNVGLEGAVVVPQGLYDSVSRKLSSLLIPGPGQPKLDIWGNRRTVHSFLAERCDRAFLDLYLSQNPELLERVSAPGLYLYAVPEVDLAIRLFEFGLFTDQHRERFVKTIVQYAVDGEDGYVLRNDNLRKMLTSEEDVELISRLRSELVPNLSKVRQNWESNHSSDEDPEIYMEPFVELLVGLEGEFGQGSGVGEKLHEEKHLAEEWVRDTRRYMDESRNERVSESLEEDHEYYPHSDAHVVERDIFDDIDV